MILSLKDCKLYGAIKDESKVSLLPNSTIPINSETIPMFISLFSSYFVMTYLKHRKICVIARDTTDNSLWLCIAFNNLTVPSKPKHLNKLLTFIPDIYPSLYVDQISKLPPPIDFSSCCMDDNDNDENIGSELAFLYSCLHMRPLSTMAAMPSFLRSNPFPHQISAVTWMLNREGVKISDVEEHHFDALRNLSHPLFVPWPADPSVYFCMYNLVFSQVFIPYEIPRKGGVLCDTMGLGKTFELILLIILHPRYCIQTEAVNSVNSIDNTSENGMSTQVTSSRLTQQTKRVPSNHLIQSQAKKRKTIEWIEPSDLYDKPLLKEDCISSSSHDIKSFACVVFKKLEIFVA